MHTDILGYIWHIASNIFCGTVWISRGMLAFSNVTVKTQLQNIPRHNVHRTNIVIIYLAMDMMLLSNSGYSNLLFFCMLCKGMWTSHLDLTVARIIPEKCDDYQPWVTAPEKYGLMQ